MSDNLILELLGQCGIVGRPNYKGELTLQFCPFHEHHYKSPSLSVNVEKQTFYCFSCHEKGHLRRIFYHFGIYSGDFYNKIYQKGDLEAYLEQMLKDFEIQEEERNASDITELRNYLFLHPYLINRGFTKEIILKNKIGFNKANARVTLPVFYNNEYYGIIQRSAVDEVPKYIYPRNMQKSAILYQPQPIEIVDDSVEVWCEGPLSGLKFAQAGYITNVILGCRFSYTQIKYLSNSPRKNIIALDNDVPGVEGTEDLFRRHYSNVYVFNYSGCNDPGEASKEQIDYGIENCKSYYEYLLGSY